MSQQEIEKEIEREMDSFFGSGNWAEEDIPPVWRKKLEIDLTPDEFRAGQIESEEFAHR